MKVVEFVIKGLFIVSSLTYSVYLLRFINADNTLWLLWILSWVFLFLSSLTEIEKEGEE